MIICLYFSLVHSWKFVPFYEFMPLFQVVHFIGVQFLIVVFYDPLHFCGVHCNFFFFISVLLIESSFFLMTLTKGLSILFIFAESQLLVSLIFCCFFFVSISFVFLSDLYDFFPFTYLAIYLFFFLQLLCVVFGKDAGYDFCFLKYTEV